LPATIDSLMSLDATKTPDPFFTACHAEPRQLRGTN
jgi:hypothetical protein